MLCIWLHTHTPLPRPTFLKMSLEDGCAVCWARTCCCCFWSLSILASYCWAAVSHWWQHECIVLCVLWLLTSSLSLTVSVCLSLSSSAFSRCNVFTSATFSSNSFSLAAISSFAAASHYSVIIACCVERIKKYIWAEQIAVQMPFQFCVFQRWHSDCPLLQPSDVSEYSLVLLRTFSCSLFHFSTVCSLLNVM